jgi:hypothetical protein
VGLGRDEEVEDRPERVHAFESVGQGFLFARPADAATTAAALEASFRSSGGSRRGADATERAPAAAGRH